MAFIEKDEAKYLIAAAAGMAAVSLVKHFTPAFAGLGRPLAKATIKGSLVLYQKGRLKAAEMSEVLEDLVAEARAELNGQIPAVPKPQEPGADGGTVQ